ncbi:MAG: hypothetical protein C0631_17200 [Sedimenticola sp.]|nr:MAG: hypothetical protein C0631_17200 [Sedimenticola sp.]
MKQLFFAVIVFWITLSVSAGEADVVDVRISCDEKAICHFSVTVKHDDQGWQHYANKWEILTTEGDILGVRELAHPHENEQPFTRSLGNVAIPEGVVEVIIRAHDLVHG